MRTENSMKNIYISILTQIVITLLGFISRKVFIDNLGTEYLGVNGLLTNVLSMMSLVEGGIGTAIVYNLYKPLAENDKEKVIALTQLYKKVYGILAIIIFILSLIIYPLLGYIMKSEEGIPFLGVVYFLFVFKNMISYLNAHKWSLINADQKGYILAKYNLLFNVITTISKIIILAITRNYILYLLIECLIFIVQNIYNGKIVNIKYPYIKTKKKYVVDKEVKNNLIVNVKALFLHNVGSWCVFGTDNILISSFISVATVGLYSNYTMIIGQLSSLLTPVIGGIGASVGNLIATESSEKSYKIFKITYLINFWIYSFSAIFLFNLLEPFINWWLGYGLLLDNITFFIILVNFYISGLRSSIITFKVKGGVFDQDKYIPLIESVINLGSSLILVKYLGLAGIFLGTTISSVFVPLWTQSHLVYKHIFNKPVFLYFKKYAFYGAITILVGAFTTYTCNFIQAGSFISLVIRGIICAIVPNTIYLLIFYKTEEFRYLWGIVKVKLMSIKAVEKIFRRDIEISS
ncbi:lipopolysaccharide biosynthesis protein [Clostridium sardiniense]|uniref:lipopolysaccharide biosynthesis protein n=1 Tax=Clostridium sardiniense TaxID=29369 RepID=UPI003D328571